MKIAISGSLIMDFATKIVSTTFFIPQLHTASLCWCYMKFSKEMVVAGLFHACIFWGIDSPMIQMSCQLMSARGMDVFCQRSLLLDGLHKVNPQIDCVFLILMKTWAFSLYERNTVGGNPAGNPWVSHGPIRFIAFQPSEGQFSKGGHLLMEILQNIIYFDSGIP